ncbi:MAG: hypothetical protein P8168_05740 [Deltaproteobacteria bacterium]
MASSEPEWLSLPKPNTGATYPTCKTEDVPLFITFVTFQRWVLPESIRSLVLKHCLHDHMIKLQVHGVVVMPDHVHMIFTPLKDGQGNPYGLAEIMNGIIRSIGT